MRTGLRLSRSSVLGVASVAVLLAAACDNGDGATERVASVQQAVMQGTDDDAGVFSGVVLVSIQLPGFLNPGQCSGALISRSVVLTAGHCFSATSLISQSWPNHCGIYSTSSGRARRAARSTPP